MTAAATRKEEKYRHLRDMFSKAGWSTNFCPLQVGSRGLLDMKSLGVVERFFFSWSKEDAIYPTFASPMQDIYWLLICSLVLLKQIFLGNQTTLSLELVVTAIVSHILVMLCVCKWTVSGGCVLNF